MNIIYILVICSTSSLATNLSILFTFIKEDKQQHFLIKCLSLTFVIMISISIFELIPEAFICLKSINIFYKFIIVLLLFLVINNMINFIESKMKYQNTLKRVGVLNAIAMFIHNIPEGIICATTSFYNFKLGVKLCLMILIHNIPEGLSIVLPIYSSEKSRVKAMLYTLFSSLGELFGVLISLFLIYNLNNLIMFFLLTVTAGIMLSISINKILPIIKNEKKDLIMGLLIGIIISILILK